MSTLRVGLTGGLASGKSTVARWLRDEGVRVVDADRLVAELYQPRAAGSRAVAELFGEEVLEPSGAVDHRRLAERVFGDEEERLRLEAAIHPLVRERFEELAADEPGPIVFEATLLVEAGFAPAFDLVVAVEADLERRIEWAIERGGLTEEEARARAAAQGDGERRRATAHRILHNDADLEGLRLQADELLAEIRRLAAAESGDAG
jgi:dephospho-CoA kinase